MLKESITGSHYKIVKNNKHFYFQKIKGNIRRIKK